MHAMIEPLLDESLSQGLIIPQNTIDRLHKIDCQCDCVVDENSTLTPENVDEISQVNATLTITISPACLRTIALLSREASQKSMFYVLGPVPLVRQLSFFQY